MTDGKAVLAIGGLGLVAGLGYLLTRKPKPPEGEGATVKIKILDAEGKPVPHSSPAILEEGASYTVIFEVVNMTTRGGVNWPAVLTVEYSAVLGSPPSPDAIPLVPRFSADVSFVAGELKSWSETFTVPSPLTPGVTDFGAIGIVVYDPTGTLLAQAVEHLTITLFEIVYGAAVVITV